MVVESVPKSIRDGQNVQVEERFIGVKESVKRLL